MAGLRYLLDTNVLFEPLLPTPNQQVLENLRDNRDVIATASVVWHEMFFGCRRLPPSAKRTTIEQYLNEVIALSIPILPYDARAGGWHAGERARLAGAGRTPPFADGQIAAVAWTNDLTLVTANLADYAGFKDVRLENWHA